MLTWLKRLFAVPPPPPTLVELMRRVDDVEEAVEYWALALKKLRGTVTGGLRAEAAAQDPPGPTNDPHPDQLPLQLARRNLRGF